MKNRGALNQRSYGKKISPGVRPTLCQPCLQVQVHSHLLSMRHEIALQSHDATFSGYTISNNICKNFTVFEK
jgi:hypothetical protein